MAKAGEKQGRHTPSIVVTAALVALWLIGISFSVLLLAPVTSILAANTVNDRLSALDHEQLVEVAEAGRAFVVGQPGATLPVGDDERVAFPPDVVQHMEDVRYVLQGARMATVALTVLAAAALVFVWRRAGRAAAGTGLIAGSITATALALLLAVLGTVSFDALFTSMHRIFFAEGTWTFAADSLLICAYPLPFWIAMGVTWALTLVLLSVLTSIVAFLLRRTGN
jgi:integral membrane protein (TIGR01906 family)